MDWTLRLGGPMLMTVAVGTLLFAQTAASGEVAIVVDNSKPRQVMEGFGATHCPLAQDRSAYPKGDTLTPELRKQALEAVYGQVKLTMGNIDARARETPAGGTESGNDNDDPQTIDWKGFRMTELDNAKAKLVDPAQPLGFDNHFLGRISVRWQSPWLAELRKQDRNRFLDEYVEQIVATSLYWRDTCKVTSRYNVMFLNEPTSGNGELAGGNAKEIAEIIKRAGKRLQAEGFKDVKFIAPNEETVNHSRAVAETILADAEARQYVAAIGYHCYPYGSPYASVKRILKESAEGKPDHREVEERRMLRELAAKHKLPLWMTEVSHPEVPAYSFDLVRGRAVHIHDELVYADAAAFFGMGSMWDTATHQEHYKGRSGPPIEGEADTPVLIDNEKQTVRITGTGYAIGHYARWIKRGAVRIEAESSAPLVQVTAFRDDEGKRCVLVVINNASEAQTLAVNLKGLEISGDITGEQSTEQARWQALPALKPAGAAAFKVTLPPLSVTSLAVPR